MSQQRNPYFFYRFNCRFFPITVVYVNRIKFERPTDSSVPDETQGGEAGGLLLLSWTEQRFVEKNVRFLNLDSNFYKIGKIGYRKTAYSSKPFFILLTDLSMLSVIQRNDTYFMYFLWIKMIKSLVSPSLAFFALKSRTLKFQIMTLIHPYSVQ